MTKKSLREFDPKEIAKFDSDMWQAYYKHKFIKLFFLLVRLVHKIHKIFGLSYFRTLEAAYYLAFAAADFRLSKGKENEARILKKLSRAFKILSDHTLEKFDYSKVAKLELEWWMIDRYPSRYPITREKGLELAMAEIYGVDSTKLKDYARYRAEAMVLQDKAENEHTETNWQEVESLLIKSFTALYDAVNKD